MTSITRIGITIHGRAAGKLDCGGDDGRAVALRDELDEVYREALRRYGLPYPNLRHQELRRALVAAALDGDPPWLPPALLPTIPGLLWFGTNEESVGELMYPA